MGKLTAQHMAVLTRALRMYIEDGQARAEQHYKQARKRFNLTTQTRRGYLRQAEGCLAYVELAEELQEELMTWWLNNDVPLSEGGES